MAFPTANTYILSKNIYSTDGKELLSRKKNAEFVTIALCCLRRRAF